MDNVRVVQCGSGFGFLHEALFAIRVGYRSWQQSLNRNEAFEMGVAGLVNGPHATLAQLLQDLEMSNRLANHRLEGI